MELHFTGELEAKLTRSAAKQGRSPDEHARDALRATSEEDARFVEAVKRGEDALQRGESLTHEQVSQRLQRSLDPDGSPPVAAGSGRPGAHLRTHRAG